MCPSCQRCARVVRVRPRHSCAQQRQTRPSGRGVICPAAPRQPRRTRWTQRCAEAATATPTHTAGAVAYRCCTGHGVRCCKRTLFTHCRAHSGSESSSGAWDARHSDSVTSGTECARWAQGRQLRLKHNARICCRQRVPHSDDPCDQTFRDNSSLRALNQAWPSEWQNWGLLTSNPQTCGRRYSHSAIAITQTAPSGGGQ